MIISTIHIILSSDEVPIFLLLTPCHYRAVVTCKS